MLSLFAAISNDCVCLQVEADVENLLAKQQRLQGQREQLCRTITLNSRAPIADWQGNFAWSNEINHLLHTAFNLQSFRSVLSRWQHACWESRGNTSAGAVLHACKPLLYAHHALIEHQNACVLVCMCKQQKASCSGRPLHIAHSDLTAWLDAPLRLIDGRSRCQLHLCQVQACAA